VTGIDLLGTVDLVVVLFDIVDIVRPGAAEGPRRTGQSDALQPGVAAAPVSHRPATLAYRRHQPAGTRRAAHGSRTGPPGRCATGRTVRPPSHGGPR